MAVTLDGNYETLIAEFLEAMNDIGRYGTEKYGAKSFEAQIASGKEPERILDRTSRSEILHHAKDHLTAYKYEFPHDHFQTLKHQLAAAAFNCMMEFYYANLVNEPMDVEKETD